MALFEQGKWDGNHTATTEAMTAAAVPATTQKDGMDDGIQIIGSDDPNFYSQEGNLFW